MGFGGPGWKLYELSSATVLEYELGEQGPVSTDEDNYIVEPHHCRYLWLEVRRGTQHVCEGKLPHRT